MKKSDWIAVAIYLLVTLVLWLVMNQNPMFSAVMAGIIAIAFLAINDFFEKDCTKEEKEDEEDREDN